MTDELPSKTQRKKDMHELQALGAELVELSDERLALVELPERLLDAVIQARGITAFGARRRQLQFIGKLMRTVDPEPIRAKLALWQNASRSQTARLHAIEGWRVRLLGETDALAGFCREYPHADEAHLGALVAAALREREAGRPPKSFRALFRAIDEVIATADEGE